MQDVVAAVIGVAIMIAFAGGLIWLIGAPPLVIITALVLAMVVIDVVRSPREQSQNGGS
jgi:Flp pilus assembly protein TadB